MALLTNTCETGLANGTGVTNGNNDDGGAGDAFSTSIGATSSLVFSTAQKAHGALSHLFTVASGESDFIQWTTTAAASVAARFYAYFPAAPSATSLIFQARNGGQAAQIGLGSDMRLRVQNATSADLTASWGALSTGVWYRIEIVVTKGTGTTDGRIQCRVYALDSTTPVSGMTLDNATTNTGTADMSQVRFGRAGATATAHTFYLDDYAAQDASTFIGPVGANVAPTVVPTAAVVTVAAGSSASFSWTENDPDGTITGRTVTRVSGPGVAPTLSSPTATSRQGTFATQGLHVYQIVATDDDLADSAPAQITVVVTGTSSRPQSIVSNPGAFVNVGGAASIQAALADELDTTWAESPANPAGAAFTEEHLPMGLGTVTVKSRLQADASTPVIDVLVELLQGSTVIASRTFTGVTTAVANYDFTTSTSETAAITDRSALRVRRTATAA